MSRDCLAAIPQPQALLQTLLQAVCRAPELQFLFYTLRVTDTRTETQTQRCVCTSVCLQPAVCTTETAVLMRCRMRSRCASFAPVVEEDGSADVDADSEEDKEDGAVVCGGWSL